MKAIYYPQQSCEYSLLLILILKVSPIVHGKQVDLFLLKGIYNPFIVLLSLSKYIFFF